MATSRATRVAQIKRLRAEGLKSPAIGRELGIAPSTVREYERDQTGALRRKRQLRYSVDPPIHLNGGMVTALRPSRKFTPHKGQGKVHNEARSRQARALIGWGAKR